MTRHTLPTTVGRRAGESNPPHCLFLPHLLHYANIRQLAFLALVIASIISTIVITKAVNAINKYGAEIGIAAYKGSTFLGMTWAATALMLLASVVWIAECFKGRKNRPYREKGAY